MPRKPFEETYTDLGAACPDADIEYPRLPLARDFFTAQEGARETLFALECIFFPRSPYNAYGVTTHCWRGNIPAESPLGKTLERLTNEPPEFLLMGKFSDTRKTMFTLILHKTKRATYERKAWGLKVISTL